MASMYSSFNFDRRPEFFSVVFRRGDAYDFTHPDKMLTGVTIREHYRTMRAERGSTFVDIVYGMDASEVMKGARDFADDARRISAATAIRI